MDHTAAAMPVITDISQLDLTKTYTYADYLTWRLDEFVELVKGKVRLMSPAPRRIHQQLARNVFRHIDQHVLNGPCEAYFAPFDVRLLTDGPDGNSPITTVVQPDLCVICDPNKLDEKGCLGSPDWVIEILSPKTAAYDTREKFSLYEEAGVAEYWIVFPGEQTVATYVLEAGRYELRGTYYEPGLIPCATLLGFAVEWAEVFAGV
ncbi:Uma2 family endonuclease [Hymenobacter psychrophilus]|uniref:Endonuclease, Uma2 family (Restriction endonuclease fold) n=1 Tax=Hymenobacter psychrophilus TaxID=651662 RepID=A0A1H3E9F6_9BACT|nr:Uma2 family endonuclease [Hymenobacter psychrophilus]SDX75247.1 Endonuclease, Uma2 family (restriction endonuclease fold) [Hymenobacter psychrophilus]